METEKEMEIKTETETEMEMEMEIQMQIQMQMHETWCILDFWFLKMGVQLCNTSTFLPKIG